MRQTLQNESRIVGGLARRLPFFYGWVIVFISFLCVFIMGATSFWALPVFVGPMHEESGWSHAAIFAALAVYSLVGAAGGLAFGHFADRRGVATPLLLAGVLICGAALISLRWAQTPLQFILLYGVIGGVGSTGMRVVQATLLAKWFVARRGTAVGISANGGGVSALIMIPVTSLLISELGWRDAWTALGVFMIVLLSPLALLAVRAPEDLGLEPDNGVVAGTYTRSAATERSYTVSDIVRTFQFWLLVVGVLIGSYSLQTHTVVMIPHFEQVGFSSATAASALSVYGLFSLGMRIIWGVLADRRGVRIAIIGQSVLTAIGAALLLTADDKPSLYVVAAFQGLVLSGFPPLQMLVWPEFFGRMHIGGIFGLTMFFSTIAGAIGPVIAGFSFDQTGSYETAIWMLVVTWLSCAAVIFVVRPVRRDAETAVGKATNTQPTVIREPQDERV